MDKLALGSRLLCSDDENTDAITDAGSPEVRNRESYVDGLREGQRREVRAPRLHHQRDRIPAFYIEQVLPHQPPVHSAVEPLVENRIVDVPIGIVVGPAGREALPNVEF